MNKPKPLHIHDILEILWMIQDITTKIQKSAIQAIGRPSICDCDCVSAETRDEFDAIVQSLAVNTAPIGVEAQKMRLKLFKNLGIREDLTLEELQAVIDLAEFPPPWPMPGMPGFARRN